MYIKQVATFSILLLLLMGGMGCQKKEIPADKCTDIKSFSFDPVTGISTDGGHVVDFRDCEYYLLVTIGDQVWMAENLRYAGAGGWSVPDNGPGNNGLLYDWTTLMNGETSSNSNPSGVKGLCPQGFHLPSDEEWNALEIYLGMDPNIAYDSGCCGERGTHSGILKSILYIDYLGFYNGSITNAGHSAHFWTSTSAYERMLHLGDVEVYRRTVAPNRGNSCRCVKD